MAATTVVEMENPSNDLLSPTRWTTLQELALLQSIVHAKPVGLHKHFRMIDIYDQVVHSGAAGQPLTDHPHVSTAKGIWAKLDSLYDLPALDEREDEIFEKLGEADESEDELQSNSDKEKVEYWRDFTLGGPEFDDLILERRQDSATKDDDQAWDGLLSNVHPRKIQKDGSVMPQAERESTVGDSEDPRSSPVDGSSSVRGTRSSGRRNAGRRLAEVKAEETVSSRRASRTNEDTEMKDAEDENEEDDEDEESEDNTADDDNRRGPTRGRGRAAQRGRGKGRRGRRGK